MCGRFTLRARPEEVVLYFGLDEAPELSARYNVTPGQSVATVRARDAGAGRVLEMRTWGLVPGWAKDPAIGSRMINARAETVRDKPAFRGAFRRRRCLLPADGFYEWSAGPAPRQPWHVARADGGLFAFAGLWEEWRGEDGSELHSASIITTRANATLAGLHERMPVILDPADYALWLDPDGDDDRRFALLAPCPDAWLERRAVGRRVNDPRHDDPECLAPAAPQPRQAELL